MHIVIGMEDTIGIMEDIGTIGIHGMDIIGVIGDIIRIDTGATTINVTGDTITIGEDGNKFLIKLKLGKVGIR